MARARSTTAAATALLALLLGAPGTARAEDPKAPATTTTTTRVIQEADKTVYRKKSVVDFSEVNVEGDLTKPEGSYVINRRKTGFDSRIRVRADFTPELQKSVDHL
ncbi:MAG TPA: hypothetical protein VIG99_07470 [Myxococcaceae bacterium]